MKNLLPVLLTISTLLSSNAVAQWQWVDPAGHPVFSDRAPPPEVPEKNIRKRPRNTSADLAPVPVAAASSVSPGKPSGVDPALALKKKQLELTEKDKLRAQEENNQRARSENCKRARQAKMALDSGRRIARPNDKGESEVLDDTMRAAESQRLQAVIVSDCK